MATLVNKFECEQAQAINDSEMMRRFKYFVNSDQEDDTLIFVLLSDLRLLEPQLQYKFNSVIVNTYFNYTF